MSPRRMTNTRAMAGKRTLVTGAASGIGRATALAAARKGAHLVVTDINAVGLQETVDLITAAGGTVAQSTAFDISDHAAVTAFADVVHRQLGSLDIVMNIAGCAIWGTVENLEHHHWKSMIDVNLMGPIHIIENFLPPMVRAGTGGSLVNLSSAAGLLAMPWHAAYSASKFGLRGLSEVLRFDLQRHNINVHLVVPGAVDTPLVTAIDIVGVDRTDPTMQRRIAQFQRRAKSPDHVAECIISAIEHNRFMVYTSNDVRFGYWASRKFAWPYEAAMRAANRQFTTFLPPTAS